MRRGGRRGIGRGRISGHDVRGEKKSSEEVAAALKVQLLALEISCSSYDAGHRWEAIRLATSLYTLLHDHGTNCSLLSMSGLNTNLSFISCAPPIPTATIDACSLYTPLLERYHSIIDDITEMIPSYQWHQLNGRNQPYRRINFVNWWNKEIVFKRDSFSLTRRQIVFALRNQEGGGHFEDELRNPNFAAAKKLAVLFIRPGKSNNIQFALHMPTMRQIAWEFIKNYRDNFEGELVYAKAIPASRRRIFARGSY